MKTPAKKFYCVYDAHGHAVYNDYSLTVCLRWIARQLGGIMSTVTVKQAMDAGFEIKSV